MTPERRDPNRLTKAIVDIATGQADESSVPSFHKASSGGKGRTIRATRLTPEQRAEASRLAARARCRRKEDQAASSAASNSAKSIVKSKTIRIGSASGCALL